MTTTTDPYRIHRSNLAHLDRAAMRAMARSLDARAAWMDARAELCAAEGDGAQAGVYARGATALRHDAARKREQVEQSHRDENPEGPRKFHD
jgi:hypothetical protein